MNKLKIKISYDDDTIIGKAKGLNTDELEAYMKKIMKKLK